MFLKAIPCAINTKNHLYRENHLCIGHAFPWNAVCGQDVEVKPMYTFRQSGFLWESEDEMRRETRETIRACVRTWHRLFDISCAQETAAYRKGKTLNKCQSLARAPTVNNVSCITLADTTTSLSIVMIVTPCLAYRYARAHALERCTRTGVRYRRFVCGMD